MGRKQALIVMCIEHRQLLMAVHDIEYRRYRASPSPRPVKRQLLQNRFM
jgi:hypothetical protein